MRTTKDLLLFTLHSSLFTLHSLRQKDFGVSGEAGLEEAFRVVNPDLDTEDQIDALLLSLNIFRRELGLRGDLAQPRIEVTTRERIDLEPRALPDLDPSHVDLGDIGAEPQIGGIDQRENRNPWVRGLPDLEILSEHDP